MDRSKNVKWQRALSVQCHNGRARFAQLSQEQHDLVLNYGEGSKNSTIRRMLGSAPDRPLKGEFAITFVARTGIYEPANPAKEPGAVELLIEGRCVDRRSIGFDLAGGLATKTPLFCVRESQDARLRLAGGAVSGVVVLVTVLREGNQEVLDHPDGPPTRG